MGRFIIILVRHDRMAMALEVSAQSSTGGQFHSEPPLGRCSRPLAGAPEERLLTCTPCRCAPAQGQVCGAPQCRVSLGSTDALIGRGEARTDPLSTPTPSGLTLLLFLGHRIHYSLMRQPGVPGGRPVMIPDTDRFFFASPLQVLPDCP